MKFDNLNKWGDYWYLPTMRELSIFDNSGTRVAGWYVQIGREYRDWTFHCLVNTLPVPLVFNKLTDWKDAVVDRLVECEDQ